MSEPTAVLPVSVLVFLMTKQAKDAIQIQTERESAERAWDESSEERSRNYELTRRSRISGISRLRCPTWPSTPAA
jgi:hypothetical protein